MATKSYLLGLNENLSTLNPVYESQAPLEKYVTSKLPKSLNRGKIPGSSNLASRDFYFIQDFKKQVPK